MSPDSRLTAAERAALADLEAAAVAADPHLAARLQGSAASRLLALASSGLSDLARVGRRVLALQLWGIAPTVVGFVLVVLGISTSIVLSVFGALLAMVGLMILARTAETRIALRMAKGDAGADAESN